MTNRRQSVRISRRFPITVEGQSSKVLDLSSSGARIETSVPLWIGGCVELQVNDQVSLRGRAVWQKGNQAGIAFHDLEGPEEDYLGKLLAPGKPWKAVLAAILLGALVLNFAVSEAVHYFTLWQVSYGG